MVFVLYHLTNIQVHYVSASVSGEAGSCVAGRCETIGFFVCPIQLTNTIEKDVSATFY